MTSFSNISGAGFASAREGWAKRITLVSQLPGIRILKLETLALAKKHSGYTEQLHSSSEYTRQPVPWGGNLQQPVFVKSFTGTAALTCLRTVRGCFCATMAELSSCHRDHMTARR